MNQPLLAMMGDSSDQRLAIQKRVTTAVTSNRWQHQPGTGESCDYNNQPQTMSTAVTDDSSVGEEQRERAMTGDSLQRPTISVEW